MSVSLVCPACTAAIEFHTAPVTACPRCGATLPDALRMSADANLQRQFAPRPLLLTIGMFGSAIVAFLVPVLLVCAAFDIGHYEVNGRVVSGPEFLRLTGVLCATVVAICAAVSYGLATEKRWARPLMLAYWPVTFLVMMLTVGRSAGGGLACSAILALFAALLAGAYLYGKRDVQAYYRALEPVR